MTSSPNPLSLVRKDCLSSGDEKRLSLLREGFLRSLHILRPSNSHSSQFSLALLQIDIFNRETYDRECDKNCKCTVLAQLAREKVFCRFFQDVNRHALHPVVCSFLAASRCLGNHKCDLRNGSNLLTSEFGSTNCC